jgi:hypothetical protein
MITALATFIAAVGGILGLLAANHLWPFHPEPSPPQTPVGNIAATPSNHTFDDVQLGQASPTRSVTVKNLRKDVATVSVSVRDDSGSFEVALETCSTAPLNPDATCQLELIFSPKKLGQVVGTVVLSLPGGGVAAQVALSGVGKPAGELSFSPTSPYLRIFTTTKPVPANVSTPLMITNTGGGQAAISTVNSSDSHFTVTTGCHGRTLAPGKSCSLTLTFAATADGTYRAKLTVNDAVGPHEIAVTGYRGPLIFIKPPIILASIPAVDAP